MHPYRLWICPVTRPPLPDGSGTQWIEPAEWVNYQNWEAAVRYTHGIAGPPEVMVIGDIGSKNVEKLFANLSATATLPDFRPGNVAQNQATFDAIEAAVEKYYGNLYDLEPA